ncbi:MAG: ABC transporter permease subunit [Acidimicrobiales bacterium]|nr:ABC transporter permease subunit [Acidimicrobiales bacterium]
MKVLSRFSDRISTVVVPLVFGAVFFSLWEWMVRAFDIKQFLLPSPSSIYAAVGDNAQRIWDGVEITGGNAVYGLVVGSIVAILAALFASRWDWFSDVVTPLASGMAAVPIVSLAPVFNIWFGSTNSFSRRLVVIVVVFFPVFVNVTKGLTQVDLIHVELMRSQAASEWSVIRRVRIPNAIPFLMSSLRLASSLAIISAIVAEYFGGTQGSLGQLITQSAGLSRYDIAWAAVLGASAVGIAMFAVVAALEWVAMPWRRQSTGA